MSTSLIRLRRENPPLHRKPGMGRFVRLDAKARVNPSHGQKKIPRLKFNRPVQQNPLPNNPDPLTSVPRHPHKPVRRLTGTVANTLLARPVLGGTEAVQERLILNEDRRAVISWHRPLLLFKFAFLCKESGAISRGPSNTG